MDGKENTPQNVSTSQKEEPTSFQDILTSLLVKETDETYDKAIFEKDDEVKKIRKKTKKPLKEFTTICESNQIDTDQKIQEIFEKFQKLAVETKANHEKYFTSKKNFTLSNEEKDKALSENSKLQKSNQSLEGLYENLMKQNKELMDEYKEVQNKEKELRTKLAGDFQLRINDISTQLEEYGKEAHIKSKENEILKEKLKEVDEKFEQREGIFSEEMTKREKQLNGHFSDIDNKFKSIQDEANKIEEYQAALDAAKKSDEETQEKLKNLTQKTDDFQKFMTDTNQFFAQIKKEMDRIALKIKKTDQDNSSLQRKSEKSDIQIIEMLEEQAKIRGEIDKVNGQKDGLEKLIEQIGEKISQKKAALAEVKKQLEAQE